MNVPLNALYQNCINGFGPLNTRAARALDKIILKTSPHEPLVQISNKFTERFFLMSCTKIAQMVSLR